MKTIHCGIIVDSEGSSPAWIEELRFTISKLAKAITNYLLVAASEDSWGQSRSDDCWELSFGRDSVFFLNPLGPCSLCFKKHWGLVERTFTAHFLG